MFFKSITTFSLAGFEIKLDASWLLIAALITWSLSQHYFPDAVPNQSAQTYFLMGLIAMLMFFASLLLHELAHSIVARRQGVPIKGITLFLFGGVAELESEPQSAPVEFRVAVAGPVTSLGLAFVFWLLARLTGTLSDYVVAGAVFSYLGLINMVLAIFNLVPAFPLDGGRILRAYIWHRTGDILKATEVASRSGMVFAYVLMALGLLSLFQGATVAGFWQMLLGSFVLLAAKSSYETKLSQEAFKNKVVRSLMTRDPVVVSPEMTLSEFVNRIMLGKRVTFVPVVEDGVLLGHMDPKLLSGIDRENWFNTRVGDVFAGLDAETIVAPDLPISQVMQKIAETGRRKFLVIDNHQLVGVITLSDLSRHLHLVESVHRHAAR